MAELVHWKSDTELLLPGRLSIVQTCSQCNTRSIDVQPICARCMKFQFEESKSHDDRTLKYSVLSKGVYNLHTTPLLSGAHKNLHNPMYPKHVKESYYNEASTRGIRAEKQLVPLKEEEELSGDETATRAAKGPHVALKENQLKDSKQSTGFGSARKQTVRLEEPLTSTATKKKQQSFLTEPSMSAASDKKRYMTLGELSTSSDSAKKQIKIFQGSSSSTPVSKNQSVALEEASTNLATTKGETVHQVEELNDVQEPPINANGTQNKLLPLHAESLLDLSKTGDNLTTTPTPLLEMLYKTSKASTSSESSAEMSISAIERINHRPSIQVGYTHHLDYKYLHQKPPPSLESLVEVNLKPDEEDIEGDDRFKDFRPKPKNVTWEAEMVHSISSIPVFSGSSLDQISQLKLRFGDFGFAIITALLHSLNMSAIVYLTIFLPYHQDSTAQTGTSIAIFISGQLLVTAMMMKWFAFFDSEIASGKADSILIFPPFERTMHHFRFFFILSGVDPIVRTILIFLYGTKSLLHTHEVEGGMKVEVKILCVIDYHLEALGTFALLEAITLSLVQILYQLPIWTARVYWTSFDESESLFILLCLTTCTVQFVWAVSMYFPYDELILRGEWWELAAQTCKFLWIGFAVYARLLILTVFASEFGYYMYGVLGFHQFFVILWLVLDKKAPLTHTKTLECTVKTILSFIYVLCYIPSTLHASKERCKAYYSLNFFENMALYLVSFKHIKRRRDEVGIDDRRTLLDSAVLRHRIGFAYATGFILAIIFKLMYCYFCRHSLKKSRRKSKETVR